MQQLTLEEIHSVTLEIMKDIDRVCRENSINYTAIGGTLIGAVRHHGFIPWDDDIDIAIKRDDYNRFVKIYNEQKKSGYELFTYENKNDYYNQFAKVSDSSTVVKDKYAPPTKGMGIWVDVFPIDFVSSKNLERKRKHLVFLLKKVHVSLVPKNPKSPKKIVQIGKKVIHLFFAPKNHKYYLRKVDEFATRENNDQNANVAGNWNTADVGVMYDKRIFDEYCDLPFEDMKIMAVKEYDKYLRFRFGDYLTPPPRGRTYLSPNNMLLCVECGR